MRVMVTGGAGFIGSHIVDRLVDDGHEVSVVDNLSEGSKRNLNANANFYDVSVTDIEGLAKAFADSKPEIVNHHAAQISVRNSMSDPANDAQVNIIGSLNVLQCCVGQGVKRMIFASTCAVYAKQQYSPMDENHPIKPESIYGVSKLSVENMVRLYSDTYGLKHKILRYGNVFGPRQRPDGEAGVVAIFTGQFSRHEQPTIFGDGSKTRDYIFVSDIVSANIKAMAEDGDDATYNLSRGIGVSDLEIFEAVRNATGSTLEPKYAPVRPGESDAINLDASKAQHALGWQPVTDLEEGIRMVVAHYRQTHKHNA